jgi:ProP effector
MEPTNKLKDINEVLNYLYAEFPDCFKQKEGIKPLKVGIFKDIADRIEGDERISKTQVRQALRKYTSNWRYLEAVSKHEFRIGLDGSNAEKVEQEHIDHAKNALEQSKAKLAKKRKSAPRNSSEKKPFQKKSASVGKSTAGDTKINATKVNKSKPVRRNGKIEPLPAANIKTNQEVKVKLGQALVKGTITEVNKDEIHVVLVTGMQVKTKSDSLFLL